MSPPLILIGGSEALTTALATRLATVGSVVTELPALGVDLVVLAGVADAGTRLAAVRADPATADAAILVVGNDDELPPLPEGDHLDQVVWPREAALLERRCRQLLEIRRARREESFTWLLERANEAVWRAELGEPCPVALPAEEQVERFLRHGWIAHANPAMAAMYGFAGPADLVGMPLARLIVPEDPRNRQYLANFVAAGYRLIDAESVERGADGHPRWFLNSLVGEVVDGHVRRAWGTSRDITAFRLVDQRLSQSEDRLRLVVEHSADGIVMADQDGVIRVFNPAAERMHGVGFREIASPEWVATFGLEDPAGRPLNQTEVPLWRALQGETVEQARWVVRRPDGSRRVLVGTATPLTRGDGARAGAVLICRDVTEQDAIERALRERIAHTRAIVDSALDALVTVDGDDRIVDWNPQAERSFGWSAAEAIGQPLATLLIAERSRGEYAREKARHLAGGERPPARSRIELCAVRRDGAEFPVELSLVPTRVDGDLLVCGYLRDLTDSKRIESDRARAAERDHLLADATAAMARLIDPCAIGRTLADACVPVLGDWAAFEVDGEPAVVHHRRASEEARVRAALPSIAALGLGGPFQAPLPEVASVVGVGIQARDERRARLWLGCDAGRAAHDRRDAELARELARRAALAIDRALLLDETRAARDQAERVASELARSNAELEQFAYVSSHDLKEPLRMVTMYLDLLERRYGPTLDGKARGYVAFARDSAVRMQRLIEDLLAYARPVTRETAAPVEANAVISAVIADLRATIASSRAIITVGPLPTLRIDRTRLGQIFQNLLANALKYRSDRAPEIVVSASVDPVAGCTFDVSDNGIGIDPAYHERIFEVFQRLHGREQFAGTGIGLAICKKIVDQLGGRIWVESQLGAGSTFRFTLPANLLADQGERRSS